MSTDGAWPRGYGHLPLAEVDSTLDEAQRRFDTLAGPTWISATRQTRARGRRGRAWAGPDGNFAATLVMRVDDPVSAALRSFVAALALDETLSRLTGQPEAFALKWPNDVLLHGGKLAGILLESITRQNRIVGLAIGIGVNLAAAPDPDGLEEGATRPVALGPETGTSIAPADFLEALAPAYAAREAQFASLGFGLIREAWLARAARLGQSLTARLPGETLTGTFRTVDETGHLVLDTPTGPRRIAAADIFF